MSEKRFQRKLAKIKKQGERYKQEYELKAAYEQYMPEKKTRKVSNIMLVVVVVGILMYTAINLWITYTTGIPIDSTLTTCFYAFWGSELCLLGGIKVSKVLKQPKDDGAVDECMSDNTYYE